MSMKKIIVLFIIILFLLARLVVYTPNYFWSNDLVEAVRDNNKEEVQELLKEDGMDIDKPGGSFLLGILFPSECGRETPLEVALINRNYELIRMLLDAGATPVMKGENPICWIVAMPYFGKDECELVQLLIEKGRI